MDFSDILKSLGLVDDKSNINWANVLAGGGALAQTAAALQGADQDYMIVQDQSKDTTGSSTGTSTGSTAGATMQDTAGTSTGATTQDTAGTSDTSSYGATTQDSAQTSNSSSSQSSSSTQAGSQQSQSTGATTGTSRGTTTGSTSGQTTGASKATQAQQQTGTSEVVLPQWYKDLVQQQVQGVTELDPMTAFGKTMLDAPIDQYMNPYLEAVASPILRRMEEDNALKQQQFNADRVSRGGFGSARADLLENQLLGRQDQVMNDTLANLYSNAFGNAQGVATTDLNRQFEEWKALQQDPRNLATSQANIMSTLKPGGVTTNTSNLFGTSIGETMGTSSGTSTGTTTGETSGTSSNQSSGSSSNTGSNSSSNTASSSGTSSLTGTTANMGSTATTGAMTGTTAGTTTGATTGTTAGTSLGNTTGSTTGTSDIHGTGVQTGTEPNDLKTIGSLLTQLASGGTVKVTP